MHLSSDQLSSWALGEQSIEMLEHVASCDHCRFEVETFDRTLSHFRSSVLTDCVPILHLPTKSHARSKTINGAARVSERFVWLTGVVCAALLFLFLLRPQPPQHPADDLLLTQIAQEISQTVPAAMEPLSSLVSGDDAPTIDVVTKTVR